MCFFVNDYNTHRGIVFFATPNGTIAISLRYCATKADSTAHHLVF